MTSALTYVSDMHACINSVCRMPAVALLRRGLIRTRLVLTTCRATSHFQVIPAISSRKLATTAAVSSRHEVDKDENSILVNWRKENNSWSKFHFDWLRDNCPCTKCKHPEYDQRLLTTLEDPLPANIDVEGSDDAVEVEWRDGHRSQYPYSWLLANSYCHNNVTKETGEKKITLWDGNSMAALNSPEVNYNDILTDDDKLLTLLRNIYQYGFCFVLDTPLTTEAMVKAASRVGRTQNSYYGQQWYMEAGNMEIKHISYARNRILPHTDTPSFFEPPGIVWFHIMKAEGIKGGATMLVDGFRVAEHIREQNPEYFSLLSRVSIPHQMTYKDEATYKMRRITFTTDDDNQLNTVYFNNTDRKPLDAISLSEAMEVLSCNADTAIKKMYQAQRYLHRMVFSEQFTCRVQLQPGRMILLNNHRVLHGRDEVVAGSRRLHGTQIGESEWLSKMKILEQKLA